MSLRIQDAASSQELIGAASVVTSESPGKVFACHIEGDADGVLSKLSPFHSATTVGR